MTPHLGQNSGRLCTTSTNNGCVCGGFLGTTVTKQDRDCKQ